MTAPRRKSPRDTRSVRFRRAVHPRYSAGISACEKGEQWQRALALLSGMCEMKLAADIISYSAAISACDQ
eukprot:2857767-Pyramimonas_sp.AAC.1